MDFNILTTLYFLLGFTLVFIAGYFGTAINQLMGIRIQRPHLKLIEKSDLPEYLHQVFESGIRHLQSLGFQLHHYQYTVDIICHQHNDKWSVVLYNNESKVYAEISPATSFLDLPGYEIDFWSIATDGTAMITMNGRGHTVLCGITNAEIHDPMAITLKETYQSHLEEQKDVFNKKSLATLTAENYIKIQQKIFDGYFLNIINERAAISTSNNEFRLAFSKVRRLLPQVLYGQKRLRKLLHERLIAQDKMGNDQKSDEGISMSGMNFSTEAEVQAYLRMRSVQESTPGGLTAKLALFLLILILSYFAFDLTFSYYSLIILFAVILLHEIGHLISMKIFGSKDYHILFFPIIAYAPEHGRQNIAIWKRVTIHLMGPIPGIVLGILLLTLNQDYQAGWIYESAVVLLVFNYLNMLPVVPLDGGYIVRYTVMERFPTGKLIFTGMGGLAFAAGGWILGEPIFWVLAVILFSTLPWSALEAGVLSGLFEPTSDFDSLNNKQRLSRLFESFRQPRFDKLQYLQKFNLVKGLSDTLLVPDRLTRLSSLGLSSIYLGILLLSPPAAIITIIGMDNTGEIVAKIQGEAPETNWKTLINNAPDSKAKFETVLKASRFFITTNEFQKAQSYLDQAENLLALIYNEKYLTSLYETYAFYYFTKHELGAAEEYQQKVITLLEQNPKNNAFELVTSYQMTASIHEFLDSTKALLDLKTALSYALNIENPEERLIILSVTNQLLNQYYKNNNHENARQMLLDTISLIRRSENKINNYIMSNLNNELGWVNVELGRFSAATEKFESALQFSGEDAMSQNDINNSGFDPYNQINIYLALAVTHNKAGMTDSASTYLELARKLLEVNQLGSLANYIASNTTELLDDDNKQNKSTNNSSNRHLKRWKFIEEVSRSTNPVSSKKLALPEQNKDPSPPENILADPSLQPEPVKQQEQINQDSLTIEETKKIPEKQTESDHISSPVIETAPAKAN